MNPFRYILTLRHLMTARQVLTLVPVLVLLLLSGCQTSEQEEQPTAQVLTVNAQAIGEAGPAFSVNRYTGVIQPHRRSQLAAKNLGRVEQVFVDLGDAVEQSQVLVQLDTEQLRASLAVAQASRAAAGQRLAELQTGPRKQDIQRAEDQLKEVQANLSLARSNLQRFEPLRRSSAISAQEFDEAQFRVEALEAQERQATEQLSLLNEGTREEQLAAQELVVQGLEAQIEQIQVQIREQQVLAPYAGEIQMRGVDEGDVVSPGQLLLQIVESAKLEVEVGLPADVAEQVRVGSVEVFIRGRSPSESGPPADEFLVSDYASQRKELTKIDLLRVAPGVESRTRTRTCLFKLPQGMELAKAERAIGGAMEVLVHQPMLAARGFWVPNSALSAGPRGLWAVFVLQPDGEHYIVQRRPVELLKTQNEFTMVNGPVDADEQIVLDGTHRIVAGQKVKLAEPNSGSRNTSTVAQDVSPTNRNVLQ